jgi:tetratricopeptide (TPR) repeat protein
MVEKGVFIFKKGGIEMKIPKVFFLLFLLFFVSCASTGEKEEEIKEPEVQEVSEAERYYSFAFEYMKQKNYDRAITLLEKAVKADPAYADAYLALKEVYLVVGDTSKAFAICKENLGCFTDPESNRKMTLAYASLLDKMGEPEKAEQLFLDVIKKNPKDANSYDMYASFLESKGRNNKALENYKIAYQYDPDNGGISFRYGNILFKLKRYREAIVLLKKAKEVFVDDIEVIKKLAECYSELGEYVNAIEEYKSIIEIIPKHVSSRIQIGNAYLKLGQYQKAESYYNEALEIEPGNLSVYYQLINLELTRRNLSGVKRYIDRGFSVDPGDGILLALYGEYYYRLGLDDMQNRKWRSAKEKFEEAIRIWKKTINNTSDSKWINYAKEGIQRARDNIKQLEDLIW